MSPRPRASSLASHFTLDPDVVFLNHGSFGATLRSIQEGQDRWRERMERQPVGFFVRELAEAMDAARYEVASFLGADPEGFAFVSNATTGVNAVLRSLDLEPGDELLTTNHAYNACKNALAYVADRAGARVAVASFPFEGATPELIVETVLEAVTPATRLLLIDYITSPTGLLLPTKALVGLVAELRERGVATLIDAAHAPGQIELDLDGLGADYVTGNFHKWVCAPKGAAFLWVAAPHRQAVRPVVISHGASGPFTSRPRFRLEFDWTGTHDPTPWLCVPDAIRAMGRLLPGGWSELRARNHGLALAARDTLCRALGVDPPVPDSMIGHMAAVPIADGSPEPPESPLYADPLQTELLRDYGIEVPIVPWPCPPKRLVRISAQAYNTLEQYEWLAAALT